MTTKQVILNQITLCADGSIGLQWMKQIVGDDGSIIFSEPHRSVIDFDAVDLSQIDAVTANLKSMGYPGVDQEQLDRVKAIDAVGRADPFITANRNARIAARTAA